MAKQFLLALTCLTTTTALGLSVMTGVAQAREHYDKYHPHAREFYAVAEEGPAVNPVASAPANHGKCFTSSTPAETARGIRHWSGGC